MINIEVEFVVDINLDEILNNVCNDTIKEIKRLINSGKNIENNSLDKKTNGEIPTFIDTGLMMNSLSFNITKTGAVIYVNDKGRSIIMDYLEEKHPSNWVILGETDYIMEFIDERLQHYLNEQFE